MMNILKSASMSSKPLRKSKDLSAYSSSESSLVFKYLALSRPSPSKLICSNEDSIFLTSSGDRYGKIMIIRSKMAPLKSSFFSIVRAFVSADFDSSA